MKEKVRIRKKGGERGACVRACACVRVCACVCSDG